jgi:tetratricopeptide (TPR) repeat protein
MRDAVGKERNEASAARRRQTFLLSLVIIVGLGAVAGINRWLEINRPPANPALEEEQLYVTGGAARRISLGFNGLIADWYWMRSLQYVGRKIIAQEGKVQLDNLSSLNLKLLYPLLDTATTLDPQFIPVYEYGGIVLPEINPEDAIKLLRKGIENNPNEWRLFHHLGYIYWQRKDYKTASEVYSEGAKLPGAPAWMEAISARMLAEGGSRNTAREIYKRMSEQATDPEIKRMAELRLLQLQSFEERDVIRGILAKYVEQKGHCPTNWREISSLLYEANLRMGVDEKTEKPTGEPLDPADTPYVLVKDKCDVDLDPSSQVPYK